jgi:maleylacetoacetate isomerase
MARPRPTALVADPLSSASLRVLCALRHKGIELPLQVVQLRAGEQRGAAHRALNPAQAVPVLLLEGGEAISQAMAILEYLEAAFPHPALLPADALQAARVRSLCSLVAADIHPLTNLRVRERIAAVAGPTGRDEWVRHWSTEGLAALEGGLARWSGRFSVGDTPSLADFFLVPAVFTMRRLGCPPAPGTAVDRVYRQALQLPAFDRVVAAGGQAA